MVIPLEYDNATEIAHGIGYVAKKEGNDYKWYRFDIPVCNFIPLTEGLTPFFVMRDGNTYTHNEHAGKRGFLDKDLNYKVILEYHEYDSVGYGMYFVYISLNKKNRNA